mmetsp:Transcript_3097/g.2576  ORF Transcript_3097/g.2576 Transcript_3097/m.2576 type:complete len:83 (-) Transcript_3097:417-665(-)
MIDYEIDDEHVSTENDSYCNNTINPSLIASKQRRNSLIINKGNVKKNDKTKFLNGIDLVFSNRRKSKPSIRSNYLRLIETTE